MYDLIIILHQFWKSLIVSVRRCKAPLPSSVRHLSECEQGPFGRPGDKARFGGCSIGLHGEEGTTGPGGRAVASVREDTR